jgi:GxxExxY protein
MFLTRLVTGWLRSHTKMRWPLSLVCETFPFQQQPLFDVLYKGHKVGLFIPDLIAFDAVVVDAKVIDRISDHEGGLMLNYLRITNLRVGVILNFKHAKLEWERIVL